MEKLQLSADEVLTTTRAVRKRLDLDRPVEMEVLEECMHIALQAPSGSNAQGWHFLFVTDPEKIAAVAGWYEKSFAVYAAGENHPVHQHKDDPSMLATQQRVLDSAQYLADNMARVPALLIPCIDMRPDMPGMPLSAQAAIFGSVLPAVWSFMLAGRERGLGTCWTTLHLDHEREVAEVLGIPQEIAQVALIPIAYTRGTDFKQARRKSLDAVLHINEW